jgi:4-aminobutyrate aminotransferase
LNVIKSASGAGFEDTAGRRYLDFHGNNVHTVGFGHPKVSRRRQRAVGSTELLHAPLHLRTGDSLRGKAHQIAPPGLDRVLLAPGGTTAIGMALKIARVATGRFKFVSMWDSFHGASLDAISVGGEAIFRRDIGPLAAGLRTRAARRQSPLPVQVRRGLFARVRRLRGIRFGKGRRRGRCHWRNHSFHSVHSTA